MAIRDQSYTAYDGPMRENAAWAVIGWTGLRTYWRFWRTKLVLFAVWLVPFVYALVIIGEYALTTQLGGSPIDQTDPGPISGYLRVQVFSMALIFIANGCGVISEDLRHRTIQLYFSKPISRMDYALGKYLTLLWLTFFGVLLPTLMLGALRTAFYFQSDNLGEVALVHLKAGGLAVFIFATMAAIVIGLSSLTRRTGYAVLAWIGVLLVPMILQAIVAVASDGSPLAGLLSFPGVVDLATQAAIGGRDALAEEVPIWAPAAVLLTLFSLGLGALGWRVSRLEGIT